MTKTGEISTAGRTGASKYVATAFLLTCLVFGLLLGFTSNTSTSTNTNLRASQPEKSTTDEHKISPRSASTLTTANKKALEPLKAAGGNEDGAVKAGGNSVGAWGPNDFEKDDWKSLFGADNAAGGSVLTFNQLMATNDPEETFSFSYEFMDTDDWFA